MATAAKKESQLGAQYVNKLRTLRHISYGLSQARGAVFGPRDMGAGIAGVLTFVTAEVFSLGEALGPFVGAGGAAFSVMAAVGAAGLYRFISRQPTTWVAYADALLLQYVPFHKDAFVSLQETVRRSGFLDTYAVREWVYFEESLVRQALLKARQSPLKFASKEV